MDVSFTKGYRLRAPSHPSRCQPFLHRQGIFGEFYVTPERYATMTGRGRDHAMCRGRDGIEALRNTTEVRVVDRGQT